MLSIAIVGLPNVGKSTLFNALTDSGVLAANYPFATIEPNTGVVPVPDTRLQKLADLYKTSRIVPASVTFVDVAGLVKGASEGEGLGNQFLSHIRACNAVVQVVRAFDDPNVIRASDPEMLRASGSDGVQGAGEQRTEPYQEYGEGAAESATPQSAEKNNRVAGSAGQSDVVARCSQDIEIINTELVLADLQTVGKRLPKLEKEARANSKLAPQVAMLQKIQATLDAGHPIFSDEELRAQSSEFSDLFLLTAKPVIYVFNVDETGLSDTGLHDKLRTLVAPAQALFICAKLEDELRSLDAPDRMEMLESYEVEKSGLNQLIHAAYETLGLQSFLTAGEKEVRAWTIPAGATAPQAAGVIHGDFERGFIAADIVNYEDLVAAGSLAAARAAGKVRLEGKTYTMAPNDVVEFKFNVSK